MHAWCPEAILYILQGRGAEVLATSNHCPFSNAVLALELAEKTVTVDQKLYDRAVTALRNDAPGEIMSMIDHSPKLICRSW